MISAKPTKNFTGVTLEGDFQDFYEITESIHRITGYEEDYKDPYWGVKNRLLSICYDIRHAYMGDREVKLTDNGVHEEMMKYHSIILPKQDVRYSVNILFTEAVFVALSVSELYLPAMRYYGKRTKKQEEETLFPSYRYSDYIKDKALLEGLSAAILGALAEAIGEEEFEKVLKLKNNQYFNIFDGYLTQYVDKCNAEYLKTIPEKRENKLRNIAKRFIKKPDAYLKMKRDLEYSAMEYRCSVHELYDPRLEYSEEIEW